MLFSKLELKCLEFVVGDNTFPFSPSSSRFFPENNEKPSCEMSARVPLVGLDGESMCLAC